MPPMDQAIALRALTSAQPVLREVAPPAIRVQYSAVTRTETPLPQGLRPSAVGTRTGALLVGDSVFAHRSEVERTADASLEFIRNVAGALPINESDEQAVDRLMARRTSTLGERPLRGRKESGR